MNVKPETVLEMENIVEECAKKWAENLGAFERAARPIIKDLYDKLQALYRAVARAWRRSGLGHFLERRSRMDKLLPPTITCENIRAGGKGMTMMKRWSKKMYERLSDDEKFAIAREIYRGIEGIGFSIDREDFARMKRLAPESMEFTIRARLEELARALPWHTRLLLALGRDVVIGRVTLTPSTPEGR